MTTATMTATAPAPPHEGTATYLKTVRKKQLTHVLKSIVDTNHQIMLKTKFLARTLNGPVFYEIIQNSDECSEMLMESVMEYIIQIRQLGDKDASIPSIVKPIEPQQYCGWVDRVKELLTLHNRVKEELVNVFIHHNEADEPGLFHFLKVQLALHVDQLWRLRNHLDR